jgi:putative aldouronate transport system substrate-binding protein
MNFKKGFVLLISMFLIIVLAACQPASTATTAKTTIETTKSTTTTKVTETTTAETTSTEKFTISFSTTDTEKNGQTAKNEWFNNKFNVDWDYIPVTWGDWIEKVRIWVASDDTPDITWWPMSLSHTNEFKSWAAQGAFREIPADLSEYPELAKMRETLVSDDKIFTVDNKLYGWPASRNNPEWLQNAWYPLFAYRRDWAKAVNMYKEGDKYTWDEVKSMIKAVKAQDPGNNGVGNTFGMTSEAWAFPGVFQMILGYSEYIFPYVKVNGVWTSYINTPEYLEELKFVAGLYREGYIWKDQMVVSGTEGADNFFAGRSFMFLGDNSPQWFTTTFDKMLDSKIISSADQVAPMIVTSPKDNKGFWLSQSEDYWSVANISHKVSDDKMERILTMWNWLTSEDGRRFRVAGIPSIDYTDNADGTMNILWPKNDDGSYKNPYTDQLFNEYVPAGLLAAPTETDRKEGFEAFKHIHAFMKSSPDYHVHPLNWALGTFDGPNYVKIGTFANDTTNKVKEILASTDDVEMMWAEYLADIMPKMQPVIDELNANMK